MTDIFISPISDQLISWSEAFPESQLLSTVPDYTVDEQGDLVFWLHQNDSAADALGAQKSKQEWLPEMLRLLRAQYTNVKIIVLSNNPTQSESIAVIKLGALGYCHAYTDETTLKEIRGVIMRGGIWIGQDVLQHLIQETTKNVGSDQPRIDALLAKVSNREKQVALEVAKGLSNKEIARKLTITERTVKAHVGKVFEALGAKDRLQLALMLNKKS
jgi:two-component system nitrate/nitrite response regulator NarL